MLIECILLLRDVLLCCVYCYCDLVIPFSHLENYRSIIRQFAFLETSVLSEKLIIMRLHISNEYFLVVEPRLYSSKSCNFNCNWVSKEFDRFKRSPCDVYHTNVLEIAFDIC